MRIAILSLALGAAAFAQVRPEWDNPAIVHVGTEKPHATMMAYPSSELARTARSRQIAVVPAAERNLEVPRVAAPVGAPDRFLPHGLQRCRLGQHAGAGELADARVRRPHLHQHYLSVPAGRVQGARAALRVQSGGQLPHALHACRPRGRAGRSCCISTAWIRPSTRGSTGTSSATARTAARRPSSTSLRT